MKSKNMGLVEAFIRQQQTDIEEDTDFEFTDSEEVSSNENSEESFSLTSVIVKPPKPPKRPSASRASSASSGSALPQLCHSPLIINRLLPPPITRSITPGSNTSKGDISLFVRR